MPNRLYYTQGIREFQAENIQYTEVEVNRRRMIVVKTLVMVRTSFFRFFELPPEIVVVNHVFGHAAVDADILPGDETGFV